MSSESKAYTVSQPVRVDAVQCYSYLWICPSCGESNYLTNRAKPDCMCSGCEQRVRIRQIQYGNGAVTNFV
jgi:hypothetical protein